MALTTVVNIRDTKDYDIYVGREVKNKYYNLKGHKFANPFYLYNEKDRDKIYDMYEKAFKGYYIMSVNTRDIIHIDVTLDLMKDKKIACWCFPKKCHADLLAKLADMSYQERWEWANSQ